jgi:hypothetical protein
MHFNAYVLIYITVSSNTVYNNYNGNSELHELSFKLHSHFRHYLLLLPVSCLLFIKMAARRFSASEAINMIVNDDSDSTGDELADDADDIPEYGIKIWWCCDAATSYPLNADVYQGRQPNEPRQTNQGLSVARNLVEPWYRSGRNIVGDNFFTSCELVEFLLLQNLTYVGTIRRNKTDIPEEMKASRARSKLSSVFGFSGQQTLVSYVPKKYKAVILLSTLHHDKVVAGNKMKPEMILHYNQTKSGVDNLDHLITNYTCKRKTTRWPMVLFMNMLDVGGIASLVVWLANNPTWNERRARQRRRLFLVELGEQLVSEQIRRRVQTDWQHCSLAIRTAAASLGFGRNPVQQATTAERPSSGRCHLCPRSADKKSRKRCSECMQCVCTQHSTELLTCDNCI